MDFLLRGKSPVSCVNISLCTGNAQARSWDMKSEHENASGNNSAKSMMAQPPEISLKGF
jgi:hypothetical protein